MMFNRKLTGSVACLVAIALLVMSPAVFAENKKVKAVFDFRISDPEAGAFVLKAIQRIYAAKPNQDIVVIFGGTSPGLLSTDREGVTPENQKVLDEIATTVSEMVQDGIQLEVCRIAMEDLLKMDPASVLPDVKRIADGFTALIEYQLDGYAIVPAF
jgi:intracellular sulfur oxidation DsrE/DsrF family protein